MFEFGSGVLLGQRTDVANGTGINFGLVQDVSFDLGFDVKELYGQNQFPVAAGRGKAKFTGKARLARLSGVAIGSLFFGVAPASGQLATAFAETQTIPGTPYQITVSNSATYVDDYGVVYSTTGLPLTRVASSPAAGQYSVNTGTGVYTFAAADTTKVVLINYTYTVSGTGEQIAIGNPLLGSMPFFQAQFYGLDPTTGLALNFKVYKATASKLVFASKLDDFMIPEIDFTIFANPANQVGLLSLGEAA